MIVAAGGLFFLGVDDGVDAEDEHADATDHDEVVEVWGEILFNPSGVIKVDESDSPR